MYLFPLFVSLKQHCMCPGVRTSVSHWWSSTFARERDGEQNDEQSVCEIIQLTGVVYHRVYCLMPFDQVKIKIAITQIRLYKICPLFTAFFFSNDNKHWVNRWTRIHILLCVCVITDHVTCLFCSSSSSSSSLSSVYSCNPSSAWSFRIILFFSFFFFDLIGKKLTAISLFNYNFPFLFFSLSSLGFLGGQEYASHTHHYWCAWVCVTFNEIIPDQKREWCGEREVTSCHRWWHRVTQGVQTHHCLSLILRANSLTQTATFWKGCERSF